MLRNRNIYDSMLLEGIDPSTCDGLEIVDFERRLLIAITEPPNGPLEEGPTEDEGPDEDRDEPEYGGEAKQCSGQLACCGA